MAMDITGVNSPQSGGRNRVNEQQNTSTRSGSTGSAQPSVSQNSVDTVKISDAAQAIQAAAQQLQSQPEVDAGRVAELKKAIENGTYSVDAGRVADKMLQFDDLLG